MPSDGVCGVLCMKQSFKEGENYVLFQWVKSGSALAVSAAPTLSCILLHPLFCSPAPLATPFVQAVFKPDFFGVLHAANGVAHTLAGAPARCLHLAVPAGSGEASVAAAYLEFRGALWIVLFEGGEVNEVSAGVCASRLLDACIANLGPGLVDQASRAWSAGRACTESTLQRTLDLLAEGGDFEFNVLRPDWLAHAFVSAEAAAQRSAPQGTAMWDFRTALLHQLDDLEDAAGLSLAEVLNRQAVEVTTQLLSSSSSSDSSRVQQWEEGQGAAAAARQPSHAQKLSCLRRLRLSVQGSAIALAQPGAAPVLLLDRLRSNTGAALAALTLGTLDASAFAGSSSSRPHSAVHSLHFFSPPPPPPPHTTASASSTSSSSSQAEWAAASSSALEGGLGSEAEAEEAAAVGAEALLGVLPPCTALAGRGELLAPCALEATGAGAAATGAGRAGAGQLHTVLAAVPLAPYPKESQLRRPPPATAPRLPQRPEEAGRVAAWGGGASKLLPGGQPHLLVLLQVVQPPAPGGEGGGGGGGGEQEEEGSSLADFAQQCCAAAVAALLGHCAKAVQAVAGEEAVGHLGGLLGGGGEAGGAGVVAVAAAVAGKSRAGGGGAAAAAPPAAGVGLA